MKIHTFNPEQAASENELSECLSLKAVQKPPIPPESQTAL